MSGLGCKYLVFFDGGSRDPAVIWAAAMSYASPRTTNNAAEYGIFAGLRVAVHRPGLNLEHPQLDALLWKFECLPTADFDDECVVISIAFQRPPPLVSIFRSNPAMEMVMQLARGLRDLLEDPPELQEISVAPTSATQSTTMKRRLRECVTTDYLPQSLPSCRMVYGYLTMRASGPVDGEPIYVPQHANGQVKMITDVTVEITKLGRPIADDVLERLHNELIPIRHRSGADAFLRRVEGLLGGSTLQTAVLVEWNVAKVALLLLVANSAARGAQASAMLLLERVSLRGALVLYGAPRLLRGRVYDTLIVNHTSDCNRPGAFDLTTELDIGNGDVLYEVVNIGMSAQLAMLLEPQEMPALDTTTQQSFEFRPYLSEGRVLGVAAALSG
ncbi:hypothetical protein P43SY_005072 [Pythium insidiosum]|uniref:Uncharacterized protein n=1 Tax=Pythium insidiosum TaxID=114742 RepID=A0AAD5M3S1_PYTIN|nr:hypothetical protein P43SY_005072 [Pythium insidiosum]